MYILLRIRLVIVLALLMSTHTGVSQTDSGFGMQDDFNILLPKVEVFIDSALAQNGMLSYRKLDLDVREADVKTKKRIWTQNLGLRGDLRYGTFNNFVTADANGSSSFNTTFSQQVNYGLGLYIQLPFFDVWNRNNSPMAA